MDEVLIHLSLQFTALDDEQLQRLSDNIFDLVEREVDHGHLTLWDADLFDYELEIVRASDD